MGALAEIVYREPNPPALLFEDISGYPKGFRAFSGATNSAKRLAVLLGFSAPSHPLDVVRAYRDRMKVHKPLPHRKVARGPVLENVIKSDIDVLKFPAPLLHEHDGGRYIGTDDLVIMRDPEQNWVNCGTYRAMAQAPDRVGLWMSPGKHGRQIREKYWKQGKPCPVLISCG
ncbi:MAG TPA: UbiD family decarboxylase, partial [Burkholderiales bacterium]|nr:UbiD family decarboxylase [Burkholderiales bacterium]